MLGLLAVNVPGFPVPHARVELTAAGSTPLAMVAAAVVGGEPDDLSETSFAAGLDVLNGYVELLAG